MPIDDLCEKFEFFLHAASDSDVFVVPKNLEHLTDMIYQLATTNTVINDNSKDFLVKLHLVEYFLSCTVDTFHIFYAASLDQLLEASKFYMDEVLEYVLLSFGKENLVADKTPLSIMFAKHPILPMLKQKPVYFIGKEMYNEDCQKLGALPVLPKTRLFVNDKFELSFLWHNLIITPTYIIPLNAKGLLCSSRGTFALCTDNILWKIKKNGIAEQLFKLETTTARLDEGAVLGNIHSPIIAIPDGSIVYLFHIVARATFSFDCKSKVISCVPSKYGTAMAVICDYHVIFVEINKYAISYHSLVKIIEFDNLNRITFEDGTVVPLNGF